MGWKATIGIIFLTAAAGAGAAFGLASFLIAWQQIPNREGASGYFAVYVTGMGLIAGFIVGLVTALLAPPGFWRAQGYALGIVLALTVAGGVLPLVLDDKGPTLDGDKLMLEVELKCPRGWKPDNKARSERGSFCWLQQNAADAALDANPIVLGVLTLKAAPEIDGQWLIPCVVTLTQSRKNRYLRVFVGQKTDVTIQVPLPGKPGRIYKQWSQWTGEGFLPQKDKPVAADYAFRYRVQGQTEYDKEHPDPAALFRESWAKAMAEAPADAPLAQWLPFFEDNRGEPSYYAFGPFPGMEAVKARPAELAPLLRSSDRNVVRHAVFAAATLDQPGAIPAALIDPLATAGQLTIDLIKEARAGTPPDEPDLAAEAKAYTFFFYWDMSMEHTGAAGIRQRRSVLEQIGRAAQGNSTDGGIHQIADQTRKELDKLGSASH